MYRRRTHTVDILNVSLATRSYPILVGAGLIGRADLFRERLAAREVLIVSNTTVAPLYLPQLTSAELEEMKKLNPKSPDELKEEQEEEEGPRIAEILRAGRWPGREGGQASPSQTAVGTQPELWPRSFGTGGRSGWLRRQAPQANKGADRWVETFPVHSNRPRPPYAFRDRWSSGGPAEEGTQIPG